MSDGTVRGDIIMSGSSDLVLSGGQIDGDLVLTSSSGEFSGNIQIHGSGFDYSTNILTGRLTDGNEFSLTMNQDIYDNHTTLFTTNGTPLAWLDEHNLSTDTDDSDLDGFTTWQEYICGTNPTNNQSFFSVSISTNSALSWCVVTNRSYSIEQTTNLTTGFTQVTNGLTESSFSMPTTNNAMYLRVKVQLIE